MPRVERLQDVSKLYPIRWLEQYVLDAALDPDATIYCHDYLTLYLAIRVRPFCPPRALKQAFDRLVARHDPLRMRFVRTDQGWRAEVLPKHPVGLIVEDLGPMTKDEQQAVVIERTRRPLTALSDALFEMRHLRFGTSGDVVLTRANHAILDGYSIALMIDELLRILLRLPLGVPPMSYGAYVGYQEKKSRSRAARKERFWTEMLLPPCAELNLGRAAKGLGPMSPSTMQQPLCFDDVLRPDDRARVEALCHATGVSAYAVLHAAFSETLCRLAGQDTVLVNGIYGRNDAKLASFIGPAIEIAPIRFVSAGGCFQDAVRDVSDKIAAVAEHLPTDQLHPDGAIMRGLQDAGVDSMRFWVLAPSPTGRMKSSPFRKFFEAMSGGSIEYGTVTLEQVPIPGLAATDAEMELTISHTDAGLQATLHADKAGYDMDALAAIAEGIRAQLARS